MPRSAALSAASVPGPCPLVTIASRSPRAIRFIARIRAAANSCVYVLTRTVPARFIAASKTASRRRPVARGALHRAPGPQDDDRLRPRRRAQRRQEAPRVADRLGVKQDAVGVRVDDERVEQLAETDVDRAAQRHHRGEADADGRGEVEHRRAHRARLRDEREPAPVRDGIAERRVESDVGADDAERVRPEQPDAVRDRDGGQRCLPAPRVLALRRRRAKG